MRLHEQISGRYESESQADYSKCRQEQSREAIGTTAPQSPEAQATAELCDCMNKSLGDMNPKVRQIIVNAGRSKAVKLLVQLRRKVRKHRQLPNYAIA